MDRPAIVVLGRGGLAVARAIAAEPPGAEVHGLARRLDGADGVDVVFDALAPHLGALFAAGRPIVGVCAAAILIRVLAPHLGEKTREPPVIAVAEDGSVAVPLLGGHRGANALARAIAERLGGTAATTTAGDARFGVAFDDPPPGWTLANPDDMRSFSAALLDGARARVHGDMPWLAGTELPTAEDGGLEILATDAAVGGGPMRLVYHPRRLALGVGCERGTPAEALISLVRDSLAEAGLAPLSVAGVYSLDLKMDEPAIHALADELSAPARFLDAAALEAETPRLATPSDAVHRAVGCHGVAEAAALAAAGPDAELVVAKRKGARATCAVARAPAPFDGATPGRARGRLAVVGIGPGAAAWRTPEADRLIAEAEDVVGYRLYLDLLGLDLLGPALAGKRLHAYGLGEEAARVRLALALAAEGRRVALVSSGDAGIYAMAALAFEEVENARDDAWRRIELIVAPGISAMQAAAARCGAPLGHDFCAISLSDLLTPWPAIERRLRAAAESDFVIALYNPVSARRRKGLARARDILLAHRPPGTPVVLASNLGRAGERVRVISLCDLDPDSADMLTLVLIGASTTRRIAGAGGTPRVYTPRGYAAKKEPGEAKA